MSEEKSGISSVTGGASGSQPQSVPQLTPVFSYQHTTNESDEWYIRIYFAKTGFEKIAIITFDDTHREFAYTVQTLVKSPTDEAYGLVEDAEKVFSDPFIKNPFSQLLKDHEAMSKLVRVFRKFLDER